MTTATTASAAPADDQTVPQRSFFLGMGVIALVAVLVRVVYLVVVKNGDIMFGDQPYYHHSADLLAEGIGFQTGAGPNAGPSATHPPLASVVLSFASWISSGNSIFEQRIMTLLLGAITVVIIGFFARDIAGPRVGLVAAGIAAITPTLWTYDGLLLSESLAALLVVLSLWCAYRYMREPLTKWAALLGLACGLAALTRAELILLFLFLVVPVVLVTRRPSNVRHWLRDGAIVGVAALVVVGPWVGYNLSRFHKPVYISVSGAGGFCGANNDLAYNGPDIGFWTPTPESCPYPKKIIDQSDIAAKWTSEGLDYLTDHLDRLPVVMLVRVGRMWGIYSPSSTVEYHIDESIPSGAAWAGYVAYWLLLPFAIWGLIVARRQRIPVYPFLMLAALVTVVAANSYGIFRFRLPADICIVVLAAIGVERLWSARQESRASASSR